MDKKTKRRKYAAVAAGIAVSFAILVYLAGVLFFQNHYYWNTVINNENYGWMSLEAAEDAIKEKMKVYKLVIIGRNDIVDEISAEEIDLKPVFGNDFQNIMQKQNCYRWPAAFWEKQEYNIEGLAEFDSEKLDHRMQELNIFQPENNKSPESAHISEYLPNSKSYEIVKENPGSKLKKIETEEKIREGLTSVQEELDLEKAKCFVQPDITSRTPNLNKLLKKLNIYVSAKITYNYNGSEVIIDGDLIQGWIRVEENKIIVNEEEVRKYINGLAKVHDTFGKRRTFRKSSGETIEIASGTYGFWTNRPEETKRLVASIKKGEVIEREPVYHSRGYVEGKDDIGNSYVEIDLGAQHLYLYKEGELILESDFVSGSVARGYQTPPGVYGLTYKERDATLRGEGYNSPVKYWMPFNGNIGMHDAAWRKDFGGEIYKTNGSHGCINLPRDKAEILFNEIEKGFPVICYN